MIRFLWIVLGVISLGLGVIGIFVPGLPTTPFLLLSATLFARGSHSMHTWLIRHKVFGKYIGNYKTQGITKKTLIYSQILMWTMISISSIFFLEEAWFKLLLVALGLIGTIVMSTIYWRRIRKK